MLSTFLGCYFVLLFSWLQTPRFLHSFLSFSCNSYLNYPPDNECSNCVLQVLTLYSGCECDLDQFGRFFCINHAAWDPNTEEVEENPHPENKPDKIIWITELKTAFTSCLTHRRFHSPAFLYLYFSF